MRGATAATAAGTGLAARAVDVWKVYGSTEATRVDALAGVTLDIPRGRFSAIMGPSGSGKSTLLHCLAGLDRVSGGQVWIGDAQVDALGDRGLTRLRREQVGFVFQLYNLLPTLTAAENITLPLAIGGRKPDQAWLDRIVTTLGLGDRLGHRPAQLSGSQQQRVACARALVTRPQVVFADEPTGNLDSQSPCSAPCSACWSGPRWARPWSAPCPTSSSRSCRCPGGRRRSSWRWRSSSGWPRPSSPRPGQHAPTCYARSPTSKRALEEARCLLVANNAFLPRAGGAAGRRGSSRSSR